MNWMRKILMAPDAEGSGGGGAGTATAPPPAKGAEGTKNDPPAGGTTTPPPTGDKGGKGAEGGDKGGAAAPPPAPKPGEGGKPAEWKVKAPEGTALDAKAIDTLVAFAKEKGLTEAQAQALVDREHGVVRAYLEEQERATKEKHAAWKKELLEDKEFGGARLGENAELVKRLVGKFGSPALQKVFDDTGAGNYPDLFRMLARIAKGVGEDKLAVNPTPSGGRSGSMAERFYGGSDGKAKK